MTVRLGLLADPHATAAPVREALAVFAGAGVDGIWCPGDIAGYGDELDETVTLLAHAGVVAVTGNHDAWYLEDRGGRPTPAAAFLGALPAVVEARVAGTRLYMVHASPPRSDMDGIHLLDQLGHPIPAQLLEWRARLRGFPHDVLLVGHTHQLFAERLGNTLVVNPGSTRFNHSCAILTLPELRFEVFSLSGKAPLKSWNWGMQQRRPAAREGAV